MLSRDAGGRRYLRVHETLTLNANVILEVRAPVTGNELGPAKVKFAVVKPASRSDTSYRLVVTLEERQPGVSQ